MNPLKRKPKTKHYQESPPIPEWLKVKVTLPHPDDKVKIVRESVQEGRLHTVCESASCPNLNSCWSRKTATYMLNGDICTRRCGYCDVATGKPFALDKEEPKRIADSVYKLGLRFIVLTAVNRDDLEDGGAIQFAKTIEEIRDKNPETRVEVLIPDFKGNDAALELIFQAKPDIINHNLETVPALFPKIAPQKNYELSLSVLKKISQKGFVTKSGLILGLGESISEVEDCIKDLRTMGVSMLTIGQYLQPTPNHFPLARYVPPSEFAELKDFAKNLGFKHVESGPLVRSSYHADEQAESYSNH